MDDSDPHIDNPHIDDPYLDDPYIHVAADLGMEVYARNMLASTFGLVTDTPSDVPSGCGRRVARAMTSRRPESVTCLACREHAAQRHLRLAQQVRRLTRGQGYGVSEGYGVSAARVRQAVEGHQDLARRFGGGAESDADPA
jgi:hypothetical protein